MTHGVDSVSVHAGGEDQAAELVGWRIGGLVLDAEQFRSGEGVDRARVGGRQERFGRDG